MTKAERDIEMLKEIIENMDGRIQMLESECRELREQNDNLMSYIDNELDRRATSIETDIDESLQHFLHRYEERQHDVNNAIGLISHNMKTMFMPSFGIVAKRKKKKGDTESEGDIP